MATFRLAHVAALCVAAACAEIAPSGSGLSVTSAALFRGEITAAAPPNYCISPAASRPDTGFVVMGRCAAASPVAADGFITVQVGGPASGITARDAADLRQILISDTGRAFLSSAGNADAISVQATEVEGDAVTVRFRDRGPAPVTGLDQTEWRGFFDVEGRLVTVAVRGLAAAPLGTDDGEVLLARTIAALRQANRGVVSATNS